MVGVVHNPGSINGRLGVEVLICTHNRLQLLSRAIDSLNNARRPEGCDVELVVAANACTDDTVRFLEDHGRASRDGRLPLRWIEVSTPGKSLALNAAIPSLKAEIVAFVDDDHRVDSGYLTAIYDAVHRNPKVNLFCGRIMPDWDGTEPEWAHDEGPYRIYPLPVPKFDQGDEEKLICLGSATPGGGNLFMRREILARTGLFGVELGPVGHNLGGAEDIEWVHRALSQGEALRYIPDALQYHFVDLDRFRLNYLVRKAYERTMSTIGIKQDVGPNDPLPLYMVRKLFTYGFSAVWSLSAARRRHFLVRTAASWGEIRGFIKSRQKRRSRASSE